MPALTTEPAGVQGPPASAEPAGVDTSRPNISRVYDYWLGGKGNFVVDRDTAEYALKLVPETLD
jgi:hypothetical protein